MIIIPNKKKSLAQRYFANVIDYAIVFALDFAYMFIVGDQDDSGTYRVAGFKALFLPVVWFLYFPFCESVFGRTLGKKAFHLYVVHFNGESPSISKAFLRRILDFFELSFMGVPALLAINYSEKGQRIGDMIADTTVIKVNAICRFCSTELELRPKEVLQDSFKCPSCDEVN